MGYNAQMDIMNQVYLKQAYIYASHSTDPSTQNGAVLFHPSNGIVLGTCNGFPEKVEETEERWKRPEKYCYVEHAERNLIYKAAKRGIPTDGMMMCCPWYCCVDCARAIIQAGIIKVVGHQEAYDKTPKRWKKSSEKGIAMLQEAGIECVFWKGKVGEDLFSIRFNGKEFSP